MKSNFLRLYIVIAIVSISSSFLFGTAYAANYLGSGYFPTSTLYRCHLGDYSTQAQYASGTWSATTDLNMVYSCSGTHITTSGLNYGKTGWVGYAYICATNGQCDNSSAKNSTYSSCVARLNKYYLINNTSDSIKAISLHEMGHCYSLAHRTSSTSVMRPDNVANLTPNSTDISLINARY
jgi:predicted Zn-dependent protease